MRGRRSRRRRSGTPGAGGRARSRHPGPADPPPPRPCGGARRFAQLTGAPVRALDPSLVLGSEALGEGDVVAAAGCELRVLVTPGHTSDSLSFLLVGPGTEPAVLTGDTVLGRGTAVIAHPDGALGPTSARCGACPSWWTGQTCSPGTAPSCPTPPPPRGTTSRTGRSAKEVRRRGTPRSARLAAAGRRAGLHQRRRGAVGAAELSVRRSWRPARLDRGSAARRERSRTADRGQGVPAHHRTTAAAHRPCRCQAAAEGPARRQASRGRLPEVKSSVIAVMTQPNASVAVPRRRELDASDRRDLR